MDRSGNDINMPGDSDLDDGGCLTSDDCDGDSNQSQSDLMSAAMGDDVTAQLAAAGLSYVCILTASTVFIFCFIHCFIN